MPASGGSRATCNICGGGTRCRPAASEERRVLSAQSDDERGEGRKYHEDEGGCFGDQRRAVCVAAAPGEIITEADERRRARSRSRVGKASSRHAATIGDGTRLADVRRVSRRYRTGAAAFGIQRRDAWIHVGAKA